MYKIAVLGDADFIGIFSLVGADTFLAEDERVLKGALEEIYKDNYGVLIVPEEHLEIIESLKNDIGHRDLPIILSLPDERGSLGLSRRRFSDFIKKAIGSEEFSNAESKG